MSRGKRAERGGVSGGKRTLPHLVGKTRQARFMKSAGESRSSGTARVNPSHHARQRSRPSSERTSVSSNRKTITCSMNSIIGLSDWDWRYSIVRWSIRSKARAASRLSTFQAWLKSSDSNSTRCRPSSFGSRPARSAGTIVVSGHDPATWTIRCPTIRLRESLFLGARIAQRAGIDSSSLARTSPQ